jgi:hypothetical protein
MLMSELSVYPLPVAPGCSSLCLLGIGRVAMRDDGNAGVQEAEQGSIEKRAE